MKRFYVHPDLIDTVSPKYNIVEPVEDSITYDPEEEFTQGEKIGVHIPTDSGTWESVASIRKIHNDEFGVLLSVEVDWGQATLLSSDA